MLHELLTGRPLFLRDSELATFRGILRDEIPSPIAMNPGVPRALSDAVMSALQRNADARYPSAAKMARALQAAIPSLIATQEEAAKLMSELFGEQMAQTRTLFQLAEPKAGELKLERPRSSCKSRPRPCPATGRRRARPRHQPAPGVRAAADRGDALERPRR